MGGRGSRHAHLKFNDCDMPKENLVGEKNRRSKILTYGLDIERVCAAEALGNGRSAFEIATKYAAQRVQFK